MTLRWIWIGAAVWTLLGCSPDEPPPHLWADGGIWLDGGVLDLARPPDGPLPAVDGQKGDLSCTVGTPDNCGFCGDICPPGQDSPSTTRLCVASKCLIECMEESYDVNGSAADGCEAKDDEPIHDSKAAAKDLGTASDCGTTQTFTGVLPSDGRKHQKAPTDRPNGRADWFKLFIDDDPGCIIQADVKVSFKNLPGAASYRVTTLYVCEGGKEMPMDVKTASGGAEVAMAPSTVCTFIGDDSGTLYIEVAKESGGHSDASYSVQVTP